MSATAERIRAVGALRRNGMPRAEIRAVLAADDPEIVRRYVELHRERLEEQLEDRRRSLDALACSLTEHLRTRGRYTRRRRRGPRTDLGPAAEVG
jgi:DNA-binding transcriptional MerR regulator